MTQRASARFSCRFKATPLACGAAGGVFALSLSATLSERTSAERAESRTLLLIIWGATVATYLLTGISGEFFSTDDAMRLVQVRDLLSGQGLFDLTQHRLNPPDGVVMHWSRLIDLPLALLIRGAGLVVSQPMAERVAATVWPAALLLVYLAGVMQLARTLSDDGAARLALLFAAMTAPVLQHFRPGAIDHHNAQLALLVWTLVLAVRPTCPRQAAAAGLMAALSLAIGLEMAPAIAALASLIALRWIVTGTAVMQTTRAFALSFAGATLVPVRHHRAARAVWCNGLRCPVDCSCRGGRCGRRRVGVAHPVRHQRTAETAGCGGRGRGDRRHRCARVPRVSWRSVRATRPAARRIMAGQRQ